MSADQASSEQNSGNASDILHTRRWVRDVRDKYYEDLAQYGQCTDRTKRLLQRAVLRYWDTLHEYADDAGDDWEEKGLDLVPRLANEQIEVDVPAAGYGTNSETATRPAISQVDPQELVEFTHRFDEVAYSLGFGAEAREQTSRSEIDKELLEEFEEWRQQKT